MPTALSTAATRPNASREARNTDQRATLCPCSAERRLLRSQGHYDEAYELDGDVLQRQQSSPTLGPTHPHTLITAGNLAADLRAKGRFREALALDRRTYEQAATPWGEDHPRTLMVAHNLALDYRLTGDWGSAYRYDEQTLERRRASPELGENHPYTLFSEANVARDLREAGRFDESVAILRDVYRRYLEVLGDQILDTLRTAKSLARSLRRAGLREEALALAEETYARYQRYFPTSPDALPADLEVAACMAEMGDLVGGAGTAPAPRSPRTGPRWATTTRTP
ncbi:tetratricopeptide repeat protein [Spirillospora sp. NPDC048824]|uniref:tetratricopeptide repeat protein n=1 Tax=Spirillospora sp. NPDC048824 TaxID=3364526 RepID=UPI003716AB2B